LIRQSIVQLERGNVHFFAQLLPLANIGAFTVLFAPAPFFLDIETTGLEERDRVTVVGLFHDDRYEAFVDGLNLTQLPTVLPSLPSLSPSTAKALTFLSCGGCFPTFPSRLSIWMCEHC
jgi:hypothetical protein